MLRASVTPLASIFGSGFLIIVPVLERTLGAISILGVAAVVLLAWFVGSAIRHIVREVEPALADGSADAGTKRLERLSDVLIVVAYVISVALYLRIMAEYIVSFAGDPSDDAERILATAAVLVIVSVGVLRGFHGLDVMERIALGAVLVMTTVLGVAFLVSDLGQVLGSGLTLPPVPDTGTGEVLLVLGGIVITVQGFETVRYLGDEYDAETRVWASRVAQLIAASIYLGFILVATPLMGLGTGDGADRDLLDITARVAPLLGLPLVIGAVLSQFSAATADTVAAAGDMRAIGPKWMRDPRPYLASGAAAIVLCWTVPTFTIIAIASRAFAAYYAVQCVIAARSASRASRKIGYGALALVLLAITLLAEPAG